MDANIAHTYVSETDIAGGLLSRFRVLYLPHLLAPDMAALLPALRDFVANGGRVVADMPFGLFDGATGARFDMESSAMGVLAQIFGCYVVDFFNTNNGALQLGDWNITSDTPYAELNVTTATVTQVAKGERRKMEKVKEGMEENGPLKIFLPPFY